MKINNLGFVTVMLTNRHVVSSICINNCSFKLKRDCIAYINSEMNIHVIIKAITNQYLSYTGMEFDDIHNN